MSSYLIKSRCAGSEIATSAVALAVNSDEGDHMEFSSSRGQKYMVSYRPQSQAGLVVANATNAAKVVDKRDMKRRGCPVSEYDVTWDVTPGEVLLTDGRLYGLLSADVDLFRKTRISKYKVSKVDTVFYTYEIMIVPSFNMIEGGGTYHFCDETGDCYGLGVNYAQDHVLRYNSDGPNIRKIQWEPDNC